MDIIYSLVLLVVSILSATPCSRGRTNYTDASGPDANRAIAFYQCYYGMGYPTKLMYIDVRPSTTLGRRNYCMYVVGLRGEDNNINRVQQ